VSIPDGSVAQLSQGTGLDWQQ